MALDDQRKGRGAARAGARRPRRSAARRNVTTTTTTTTTTTNDDDDDDAAPSADADRLADDAAAPGKTKWRSERQLAKLAAAQSASPAADGVVPLESAPGDNATPVAAADAAAAAVTVQLLATSV